MKKFLIMIFAALFISAGISNAQTYKATAFAFGVRNSSGSITWDKWEKSTVKMNIDWDNEVITVFSKETQRYVMITADPAKDTRDGKEMDIYAIDNENIKCVLKLCILKSGVSQFYVYYNDIAWVYNIVKI